MPVVKITGNERTWQSMRDHMDIYVGTVLDGKESLPEAGVRIRRSFSYTLRDRSLREITGYTNSMDIYVLGPVI